MIRKTLLSLVPLALLVVACGGDDDDDAAAADDGCVVVDGTDADADSEVHASLTEYAIDVAEDGADAGVVRFETANEGAVHHELVVLQASADEIEVGEDGAPVEVGFIGEIEGFPAGEECAGSFELAAGTYTLLCAIVEESGVSHFSEGMVTEITVS
jgi:hypothetical protein